MKKPPFTIRLMKPEEWSAVAELIHLATNTWYEANRGHRVFQGLPETCQLFCQVYEELDPGCCLVAVHEVRQIPIGACFIHPRETHVSLGIMTVHPSYFSLGIAGALMERIIHYADERDLPLRLVSSAMNLDSFSLYSKNGFAPVATYQDMTISVPRGGLKLPEGAYDFSRVREADLEDVVAMGALEFDVAGISRERDYCFFLENDREIWRTTVIDRAGGGGLEGFLVSVDHPASNLLGPGVTRDAETAATLIAHQLDTYHRGNSPIFLVPSDNQELVQAMYALGARNCELHFAQVRGEAQPIDGIVMPTFMPETG